MYEHDLFGGVRNHHVGIDLGAPAGEPVHAFDKGLVFSKGVNSEPGSYGQQLSFNTY